MAVQIPCLYDFSQENLLNELNKFKTFVSSPTKRFFPLESTEQRLELMCEQLINFFTHDDFKHGLLKAEHRGFMQMGFYLPGDPFCKEIFEPSPLYFKYAAREILIYGSRVLNGKTAYELDNLKFHVNSVILEKIYNFFLQDYFDDSNKFLFFKDRDDDLFEGAVALNSLYEVLNLPLCILENDVLPLKTLLLYIMIIGHSVRTHYARSEPALPLPNWEFEVCASKLLVCRLLSLINERFLVHYIDRSQPLNKISQGLFVLYAAYANKPRPQPLN